MSDSAQVVPDAAEVMDGNHKALHCVFGGLDGVRSRDVLSPLFLHLV